MAYASGSRGYRPGLDGKNERGCAAQPRSTRAHGALVLACAAGLALALGCAQGGPPKVTPIGKVDPAPIDASIYRVGPADQLSIRVLPEPAIERTARVRPDGRFSMDLVGDVDATGRTTDEIAREIEQRIAEYRVSPSVTVSVEEIQSTAISVTGEVETPSSFPLERELRLSEAVAMAGGATEFAATARVRIVRRVGDQTLLYLVNLDRIQAGDATTDYVLERGDLVYVPAAVPVVVGYNVRRALYPLEVLMNTIAGPLLGFVAGQ